MTEARPVAIDVEKTDAGFRATCDYLPGVAKEHATHEHAVTDLKVAVLHVVAEKGEPPFAVDFKVTLPPGPRPEPESEEEPEAEEEDDGATG